MKGPHAPALHNPESQVDLVGVLFLVWGGITILIGASTLALGMAAASLITAAADAGRGQFAASVTASTFSLFAIIAILYQHGTSNVYDLINLLCRLPVEQSRQHRMPAGRQVPMERRRELDQRIGQDIG